MKSKIIIFGLVVIFIILVVIGLNKENNNGVLKIGVIAPLSGQYGAIGESIKNAAVLSLGDEKNIELIFEDSKFDQKTGLSAYHKLVSIDNVDMIINVDSPTLESITPSVNETNIPVFQLFEAKEHKKDSIFQLLPFSYGLFSELGKLAEKRYQKIAVVYNNSTDVLKVDADYFKKGITSPKTEIIDIKLSSNSDYRSEITKMISENPDAFTLIMALSDGTRFLKEFNELIGNNKISLICDANIEFVINDYVKAVGTSTFEGCISTNLPDTTTAQFKSEYRARYGTEPMIGADWAYDAVTLIKELSQIPKNEWLSKIQSTSFDGVSGKVQFDETGTRLATSEDRIFKNGKFMKLE